MHAPISAQTSCAEAGQLDQSLALHEAALDSLSHGLFMLDAELRLVLYNSRYLEMYGLTPDEVRVGMSFVDMLRLLAGHGSISDEQIEEHHRKRREMMARGEPFRLVRQISDGRTYLLNTRPVAGGCWVTTVEDVSDRQREEYELRIKFERFDQAVNHMSHGLCAVDADHRIVLFNQLFLEMYNLSPDYVRVGLSLREIMYKVADGRHFPDAEPERVWHRRLERWRRASRSSNIRSCAAGKSTYCTIIRPRTAAG